MNKVKEIVSRNMHKQAWLPVKNHVPEFDMFKIWDQMFFVPSFGPRRQAAEKIHDDKR